VAADASRSVPPLPDRPNRFTVVVPTLGGDERLAGLLTALEAQTLPRDRWSLVVAFDGASPSAAIARRIEAIGGSAAIVEPRRGPGAARNLGAHGAAGDWLAFTEDDCLPAPDWLAAAAARIARERDRDRGLDVLEGATHLPDGRPARRRHEGQLTWLPTNLFVRKEFFERIGGYCEHFFDPRRGVYFREDSDFGFTSREAGARVTYDPASSVTHPHEHPGWLDPVRWARRYEMDPLLAARHPRAFREEIEVVRVGPLRLRRPFVRACGGYVLTLLAAAAALAIGEIGVAAWFVSLAGLAALLIWSKWRFDPRKLPAVLIVPPILLAALLRGKARAYAVGARPPASISP
jgi:glycosyltransferase involved in cell wall biosynthesis